MTESQIDKFLALYDAGEGMVMALRAVGATLDEHRADLRANPSYRRRFRESDLNRREQAESVLLATVKGCANQGDANAAVAYMRLTQKREELREAKIIHRLALRAATSMPPDGPAEPDFRLLNDQQWDEYLVLYGRIEAGESLSTDEAISFARLVGVASSRPDQIKQGLTYYGGDDAGGEYPPSTPRNGNGRRNGHG